MRASVQAFIAQATFPSMCNLRRLHKHKVSSIKCPCGRADTTKHWLVCVRHKPERYRMMKSVSKAWAKLLRDKRVSDLHAHSQRVKRVHTEVWDVFLKAWNAANLKAVVWFMLGLSPCSICSTVAKKLKLKVRDLQKASVQCRLHMLERMYMRDKQWRMQAPGSTFV